MFDGCQDVQALLSGTCIWLPPLPGRNSTGTDLPEKLPSLAAATYKVPTCGVGGKDSLIHQATTIMYQQVEG